jgi:hypothetical protein
MERMWVWMIVAGMLVTGTINTLLNKYQDLTCVADCDTEHKHMFEQPLLQTLNMFVGEILCLFAWSLSSYLSPRKEYQAIPSSEEEGDQESEGTTTQKPELTGWLQIYFLLPTICDLTATTLMNVGLMFISASIYQM